MRLWNVVRVIAEEVEEAAAESVFVDCIVRWLRLNRGDTTREPTAQTALPILISSSLC